MQSNLFRFFLALILACVAALANFMWLSSQKPSTTNCLYFKKDIKQGSEITDEVIGVIALPAENANLKKLFVTSDNSNLIKGTRAIRNFGEGEFVQNRDVLAVNKPPEYRVLGPFRLISVGDRVIDDKTGSGDSAPSGAAVTVAAEYGKSGNNEFDLKTRRLLQIIDKTQKESQNKPHDLEILAVVAYPDANSAKIGENALSLDVRELALFVPMPNVPAIPSVLLTSKSPQIGFVVPASVLSDEELKEALKY